MSGLDLGLGNLNPIRPGDLDINLGLGGRKPSQRAEWRKLLSPDEEQFLSRQALGVGLSGLSYIGGTLDKPGQAVRGVLAGKGMSALKNLIPFSDSLGITTDVDHTTGRDLTDQIGLTRKGDKGWGSWGVGLAADMATDPLSYATFGAKHALTAAGQGAKKAGALQGLSRADMIRRGYSGTVGIGLPFQSPSVVLGTGSAAANAAVKVDKLADWARFSNPVGRSIGALFDKSVGGTPYEVTQRSWAKYGDPTLIAEQRAARGHQADVLQALDPLVSADPTLETQIHGATRALAEGVPTMSNYSPAMLSQVQGLAGKIGARNDAIRSAGREWGLPFRDLDDMFGNYVHREALSAEGSGMQLSKPGSFYQAGSGSSVHREPWSRDVPGGTERINGWFRQFAGADPKTRPAIEAAVRKDLEGDLLAHPGGFSLTPSILEKWDGAPAAMGKPASKGQVSQIVDKLLAADPKYREQGLDFYTPNLAATETKRGAQHARNLAAAKAAIGAITDNAARFQNDGSMMSVPDLIKAIGLRTTKANKVTGDPIQGALLKAHEALAPKFQLGSANTLGSLKKLRNQLGQFGVTREHADQILKAHQKWAAPEELKGPLKFMDSLNALFKPLAYSVWFPSHVRNAGTAGLNNLRSGTALRHYNDAKSIIEGTVDPAALSKYGLGDLNQARKEAYASAGIFGGHGYHDDVADNALSALTSTTPGRFTPHAPGAGQPGMLADMLTGIPRGWLGTGAAIGKTTRQIASNPRDWKAAVAENLGMKGVGGVERDALPAVVAGRKVGTQIEDTFRLAQWLAEREQGATANAAADMVNRTHFDYDSLTGFEKNVMRRLVPFYTYARKNLPLQLDTALHTPAWTQAQIRPFSQPDQEQGYVPEYLKSGVSMPVGPEANGMRRYVSKLGLPVEEAFERLHFRNGLPDIGRTALDYMGQLNPVIKAPLEQLFDTQFHTQRKLSDLRAPAAASAIGRLFGDDNPQLLAQVMANTPLTRFVTSADKLIDDRKDPLTKAVNLLTGVRVTDVDTEKQRAIDTRNALEEILRGQPHLSKYTSFYVKPDQAANLTPDEVELMRLYATLQQHARDYSKQQRQSIGVRRE